MEERDGGGVGGELSKGEDKPMSFSSSLSLLFFFFAVLRGNGTSSSSSYTSGSASFCSFCFLPFFGTILEEIGLEETSFVRESSSSSVVECSSFPFLRVFIFFGEVSSSSSFFLRGDLLVTVFFVGFGVTVESTESSESLRSSVDLEVFGSFFLAAKLRNCKFGGLNEGNRKCCRVDVRKDAFCAQFTSLGERVEGR